MALRMPPLASLRLFEAAARLGTFRAAADEVGLTPSAVSHGISKLEGWLGIELFHRKGQSCVLTQAGRDFLPYAREGLSTIAMGARRVSPLDGDRKIRVSSAHSFASDWLIPRLKDFRTREPAIQIVLDTARRATQFAIDGVDVAFRMGTGPWTGTRSHLLFRETLVPVAAADLAAGPVAEVPLARDRPLWASGPLIRVNTVEEDWQSYAERFGLSVEGVPSISVDTVAMALLAAREGLGFALGRLPLSERSIERTPALVRVGEAVAAETGHWLAVPEGRETRRDVDQFTKWVMRTVHAENDEQNSP